MRINVVNPNTTATMTAKIAAAARAAASPGTEIIAVQSTEGPPSIAYVGPDGTFIFRDRHHRLLRAASLTPQATFAREPTGLECCDITGFGQGGFGECGFGGGTP